MQIRGCSGISAPEGSGSLTASWRVRQPWPLQWYQRARGQWKNGVNAVSAKVTALQWYQRARGQWKRLPLTSHHQTPPVAVVSARQRAVEVSPP